MTYFKSTEGVRKILGIKILLLLLIMFSLIYLFSQSGESGETEDDSELPNLTESPENETTAGFGNETIVPGNDTIVPGNETIVPGNETIIPGNETAIENATVVPGAFAKHTLETMTLPHVTQAFKISNLTTNFPEAFHDGR